MPAQPLQPVSDDQSTPAEQEKLRVLSLFPTFVWYSELDESVYQPINEKISRRLDEMVAAIPYRDPQKLLQSDQNMHHDEAFDLLVAQIIPAVQGALNFMKIKYQSFQITGCWANIGEGGQDHSQHSHPNNFLSGVYYVKASKGGNAITFHDPRIQPSIFNPPTRELTNENAGTMNIGVKPGTLILFPAWLEHSVPHNSGAGQRISVAFNIMFSDFENQMSKPLWKGNF